MDPQWVFRRVQNEDEFIKALDLAFDYDLKVVIEEEIKGREIECAVLGNEEPRASVPGEIIPHAAFIPTKPNILMMTVRDWKFPARLSSRPVTTGSGHCREYI